jgi:hypothetical protein
MHYFGMSFQGCEVKGCLGILVEGDIGRCNICARCWSIGEGTGGTIMAKRK